MATHSSILAWKCPWTEEPGDPMDREARQATVNRVKKSQTQLQRRSTLAAYMFSNCFLKALCQPMVNRYFLNPYYAVGLF